MARKGKTIPLVAGPFRGVNDATDPFENANDYLYDAVNCYIPDPDRGSGVYQRPGFFCPNAGAALASSGFGRCVYDHTDIDGTIRRFVFVGTKVYRWDGVTTASAVFTDVTPVGVTISTGAPIFCTSLAGKLIVNDGINEPWIGTDLSATPITGTEIEYNTAGSAWIAFGAPTVVGAKVFFVVQSLNGTAFRSTVIWSEEGDPATGYLQDGFDNSWELQQTSSDPIFNVVGDNSGFTYFRAGSIGTVQGTVNDLFATASTHDNVSTDIGCPARSGVVTTPTGIWFSDIEGKVWRLPPGGQPVPVWKQMRRALASLSYSGVFAGAGNDSLATYYAPLDLVLMVLQPGVSVATPSTTLYVFHASTGTYVGTWTIESSAKIHAMGVVRDKTGAPTLIVLGGKTSSGFVYFLQKLSDNVWEDNSDASLTVTPTRSVTPRFVVDDDQSVHFGEPTAVLASNAAVALSYTTPYGTGSVSAATPTSSSDGTYRAQWGTNAMGREARFTITPSTAVTQWGLHSFSTTARVVGGTPGMP